MELTEKLILANLNSSRVCSYRLTTAELSKTLLRAIETLAAIEVDEDGESYFFTILEQLGLCPV